MHPAHIRRIGLLDGDPLGQLCVVWAVVSIYFACYAREEFWCTVLVCLVGFIGLGQNAGSGGEAGMRLYHTYPVTFSFSGTFPELLQRNFLFGVSFFAILFDFPSGVGAGCRRVGRETNTMNIPYILSRTENTIFELWCWPIRDCCLNHPQLSSKI